MGTGEYTWSSVVDYATSRAEGRIARMERREAVKVEVEKLKEKPVEEFKVREPTEAEKKRLEFYGGIEIGKKIAKELGETEQVYMRYLEDT